MKITIELQLLAQLLINNYAASRALLLVTGFLSLGSGLSFISTIPS